MKHLKLIILLTFLFLFAQCEPAFAQRLNKISSECPSPDQLLFSSIIADNQGNLVFTLCPSGAFIGLPAFAISPLTTKGDIWGYNTTNARVPVGSNDQVLIADSAQTLGVKWGASPHPIGATPFFPYWSTNTTLSPSPFSWSGTLYKFNNTALNANWRMEFTPNNTTGIFRVGDVSGAVYSNRIVLDQSANTALIFGKTYVDLHAGNDASDDNFLNLDSTTGSLVSHTKSLDILQSPSITLENSGAATFSLTAQTFTFSDVAGNSLVNLSGVNRFRFKNSTAITPTTAGASNHIGTALLPFSSLFIGAAATNNIQLIGTATSARVVTLPDATGTVQLQGGSGTISGLTTNAISKAASSTTLTDSRITDNGANININSGAGVTTIGDVAGGFAGTTIVLDDTTQSVTFNGDPVSNSFTLGSFLAGSTLQTVATATRAVVFPDAAGVVQLVGSANTGTVFTIPLANNVLANPTGTVYTSPCTTLALSGTTEGNASCPITRGGTIRNLYVRTGGTAKINSPTTTVTIRKNGTNQSVTLTMTEIVNTTTSDTVNSFTVVAGDLITVSLSVAGAIATSTSIAGITFELD